MEEKKYGTNYRVATQWLNNSYVLCNNITTIDPLIFENARFSLWGDDEETISREIYQWFITDANEHEVDYLERTFGLLFTYSELLDCFILCVDHFGTMWDYVYCETTNEFAKCELGGQIK